MRAQVHTDDDGVEWVANPSWPTRYPGHPVPRPNFELRSSSGLYLHMTRDEAAALFEELQRAMVAGHDRYVQLTGQERGDPWPTTDPKEGTTA